MNSRNQSYIIYLLLFIAIVAMVYVNIRQQPSVQEPLTINQLAALIQQEKVSRIVIENDNHLQVIYRGDNGNIEQTAQKEAETTLVSQLVDLGVTPEQLAPGKIQVEVKPPSSFVGFMTIASYVLPFLLLGGLFWFIFRQAQGSNNAAMSFGKSRARMFNSDHPTVTFEDVAGVEESKEELKEVVEFLREPQKFIQLGARIPKGVLLVGPPGTGKTLLAKAVSGEAGVPFFSISGSEFVEMFVGVGASVTGDTPILIRTLEGTRLLPIAEFVDGYYQNGAGGFTVPVSDVQTLGYEEKDSKFKGSPKCFFGQSAWKNVASVYRHWVSEIYEIHYLGGVICTTGDHSIFVRTRDGMQAVAARNLKHGDVLVNLPLKVRGEYSPEYGTPYDIRAHTFSNQRDTQELHIWDDDPAAISAYDFALEQEGVMSQVAIGRALGVSQATVGNWQRGINTPRPLTRNLVGQELPESVSMTPDLLKLMGYYTAEGRATPHLEFIFGAHEGELHEDCIALMRRVFGVAPTLSPVRDNSLRIAFPRPLGRFFARYCGEGSHNKHAPELLWHLPKTYFVSYLEGYARGDGYVTREGKLSITSASKQLITELTWLCAMHGIKAGVRHVSQPGGRVIRSKPLPEGEAWNLIIGKTSNPFAKVAIPSQGKKPVVQEVIVKPYEGYVYDLCGCENEAFFGGEKPILLHNSRVRDLFEQAKRHSPCIVFVDEIDAVGRQRGAGLGGSHDEREQTLNQMLVEMDGFDTDTNVIIMAATNRPDILDPALLRPGRFDRRVVLDRPDMRGREAILRVHVKGKPLEPEVDLGTIARGTPGFVGADLENTVNEAAILAARRNKKSIGQPEFEEAIERVVMGPERKSRLISAEEKRIIAYHEAGHAVVINAIPEADPVQKITIVGRGQAEGITWYRPEEDRVLTSRKKLIALLAGLLGGRAAEVLIFDDITSGASNDLAQVTKIARNMVTRWGMSGELGQMTYGQKEELIFLGREISEQRDYSESIAQKIDIEVRKLIDEAFTQAQKLLKKYRTELDSIANRLLEVETLTREEFEKIFPPPFPKKSGTPQIA